MRVGNGTGDPELSYLSGEFSPLRRSLSEVRRFDGGLKADWATPSIQFGLRASVDRLPQDTIEISHQRPSYWLVASLERGPGLLLNERLRLTTEADCSRTNWGHPHTAASVRL